MAQASIATNPVASGGLPGRDAALTAADLDEIREYQKIVSFRDTIVSGKHPRIKVAKSTAPQQPASLATERVAPPPTRSLKSASHVNTYQVDNMQSFKANSQNPQPLVVPVTASGSSASAIPGIANPVAPSRTGTGPSLAGKPAEDSAKAETLSRRRRIEAELAAQFEQRKASAKTLPFEQLPDLDISDIFAKALTLVQATAPPPVVNPPTVAVASDSSDSFDDNTFYSSSIESPDVPASPRIRDSAASAGHQVAYTPRQGQVAAQPVHVPTLPPFQPPEPIRSVQPVQNASSSRQPQPSNNNLNIPAKDYASKTSYGHYVAAQPRQAREVEAQVISSDSRAASRSDNSGNTDSDHPADHSHVQNSHQFLPSAHFTQPPSPLIRAHDLSPFAPQPAHVSPLAIARQPPVAEPDIAILRGTPAQVTALRQENRVITSPESSPQGEKGNKRNKKKKNKRKAEQKASDIPASPYIKSEPRSPSPLSALHFGRPSKRLRPSDRSGQEPVYDDARIERPAARLPQEQYRPTHAHTQAERPPYSFEDVDDPYVRPARRSVAPTGQMIERTVYEERRPDGTTMQYIRRIHTPHNLASPFSAVEARPLRSASYSVNPPYREVPTYPHEGRISVRPYADRARSRSPVLFERESPIMAPPAPPPARIVVDQYGREYIDPPRASAVGRHSAVPSPRAGEHDFAYERAPLPRVPSRMPGGETFEDQGVIYRRLSPTYGPRRVVTQPEYTVDYRRYRERDYSAQPVGAPGQDFVPIRGAMERRAPEDISRDYLPRAASVRPLEGAGYYDRLETIRSDMPPRPYAASVHPEVRRESGPPVLREYSVRPTERDAARGEFSARPAERYYDRPPHLDEEVTYIERPRAAQQDIIYADNSRRQVYQ
ncbi:hypothetical protein GGS23DRAFT_546528 [Durotheca rogersii]|uniref:uncharacterized protein n=1 Tax=Durotheca rogersii TaxID=419775 RepID=UPI00221F5064|nr:uncharacterized protein GGS23DRAFT_546528 [Durotheca rogersii]KAI5868650.1 hypothetical protein GGS23DRAFT_546528 [Durotheca rogersii]